MTSEKKKEWCQELTIFFRIETLEEEGEIEAGEAATAAVEAARFGLTGDVDACRWICSPGTPPTPEAQHSCDLFVDAEMQNHEKIRLNPRTYQ